MRVTPVSGDLLVKVALVIGGAALVAYAVRRMQEAVSGIGTGFADGAGAAWSAAREITWSVAPWNNENVIYQGVNNTLFPSGQDTLGTWLYGVLNPEPKPQPYEFVGPPNIYEFMGPPNIGGSASVTPGYTGSGGAAFGWYPR